MKTTTVRGHVRKGRVVRQYVRRLSAESKQALWFYREMRRQFGPAKARSKALSFFYGKPKFGHGLTTLYRGPRRVRVAVEPKMGWKP